ncbi:MAG: tRNA 4-thiouridine(8) synthase ThiI [Oscillospiraceae bacterium]|nr:tRNA 4-thiouridine(8) synthase ThiI [Oscillospiraceae bacterium]
MKEIILLKMGELVLKGLNRARFERSLLDNTARRLRPIGPFALEARQSTVMVAPQRGDADMDAAFAACAEVFGIAALTRAAEAPKEMDAIIRTALAYLDAPLRRVRSFKVEARRADKRFPLTSPDIARAVGGALHGAHPGLTVDVEAPELLVMVEVRDTAAYIHAGARPGAGGLPLGVGGKAVCLLSGGIDSPVAVYLTAKRGVVPVLVHFYSYPYTSPEARDKVVALARLLADRCGAALTLCLVPFTAVQEAIRRHCPEAYSTLLLRRAMMAAAERVAQRAGAPGLVTGESLGQVASQTLESLGVTGAGLTLPVLRPLIGLDKEEIVTRARRIGTYDVSVLPFEDCCTVFTPRHPKTKPRLPDVLAAEAALPREALLDAALAQAEWRRLGDETSKGPPESARPRPGQGEDAHGC